ncbi:heterokaryon incompatibility protein-domain-containing protein [Xylogone sp. PMI_703]|nr:heterokaryon incompatibility protein-domain-containing protein [Xylogone sp. PMI_703]
MHSLSKSNLPGQLYHSLVSKNGERFIRLLRILPGNEDQKLRCSLKMIDLNKSPVYDCLSYTWNDPLYHDLSADPSSIEKQTGALIKEIECDGIIISITENLEDALLQFRKTNYISNHVEGREENVEGFIWIDAVCINQEDNAEKGVQIAMMDEIYSKARRVIAWLGRSDEHTDPALEIIQRLKSIPLEKRKVTITDFESPEYLSILGDPPISSQQWNDYAAFVQRAWFNRVWVIQEAYLAKHIDVLCGPHVLSWEHDIWEVSKFLRDSNLGTLLKVQADGTAYPDRKTTTYTNNSLNNQYQLQAMKKAAAQKPLSLELLLTYSRYFQATQAQDHVFGLLGIWKFSQGVKELPKDRTPDYSLSKEHDFVARIFTQYSWLIIRDTGDLNILSLVDDVSTRQQKDLPSWVPDYSVGFHVHPLAGVPRPDPEHQRWSASKGLPFEVPLQKDPKKLPVKGILFDTIEEVAATYSELMDQHQINSLLALLARYPAEKYPDGSSPIDAFWRTLIKETFRQRPADGEARDAFPNLIIWHVGMLEDGVDGYEEEEGVNQNQMSTLFDKTTATIGEINSRFKDGAVIPDMNIIHNTIEWINNLEPGSAERGKLDRDSDDISEAFRVAYSCRKLFRTKRNYFGIAAESLAAGDKVWILAGAAVPLILRPAENGGNEEWKVIGEAYIHGIMNGEAVRDAGEKSQQIYLV